MKMKLTLIFFITICLGNTAVKVYAQQISLREVNAPFETVYKDIQKQTDYHFAGTTELLNKAQAVSVNLVNAPLNEALAQIFSDQPLSYTIYNKMVIIKDKEMPEIKEKVSPVDAVVQDNYSISGTVSDEKGMTLPGATVFLTNTKNATSTDNSGKFILNGISPGSYEFNVKMLGFEPNIQIIKVYDKPVNLFVRLKESNITLNEVSINGGKPDPNRKRYMKLFIENFIGKSASAALCKILNPDVLNFHYDKKTKILTATAADLLVIENDALGYQLKYLLKKFEFYDKYQPKIVYGTYRVYGNYRAYDNVCYYEGNPYFEELKGTEAQQQQWEKNRRTAYLGSYRHFFRSVMNNTAAQAGFAICQYQYKPDRIYATGLKHCDFDSVFVTVDKNVKALVSKPDHHFVVNPQDTSKGEFYIVYDEKQPHLFLQTGSPLNFSDISSENDQLSKIRTFADTIKIDDELLINPTKDISFLGYWAWGRIAELTPLEYFVDPLGTKEITK